MPSEDSFDHRDPEDLKVAFVAEDGNISRAAEHFDVVMVTVRTWLIKHGIYDPDSETPREAADRLESDVDVPEWFRSAEEVAADEAVQDAQEDPASETPPPVASVWEFDDGWQSVEEQRETLGDRVVDEDLEDGGAS